MSYIVKVIPAPAGVSSTNVVYIPALGGTAVDLNSTQTLTNKTLTNAVVSGSGTTLSNATINGATVTNSTVTSPTVTIRTATFAAAGANIATANAITTTYPAFILATGANGSAGVQLPAGTAGAQYTIHNSPAANAALKVYPQVNSQINEAGSNTALTIAANSSCILTAYNATHWYSTPKVPS
jgi:hypothetical protein